MASFVFCLFVIFAWRLKKEKNSGKTTNEALKSVNANTYIPVYENIKDISRKLVDSTKYVVVNDPHMAYI